MRKLFAFLVWLFSFWTWKDFFLRCFLRWLRSPASHPASGETAEHLLSQDGQQESNLARFLSSLPEDGRICHYLFFDGGAKVGISFGRFDFTLIHGTRMESTYKGLDSYQTFLEAVASSKIVFRELVNFELLVGERSCKYVEAFGNALRQSSNKFRKLHFGCENGSAIQFAKCVSSVLLGSDAIQDLTLYFGGLKEDLGKELAAEFMTIIAVPHNLRILKSFRMRAPKLDGQGMEQLMKPFHGPSSVLEDFQLSSIASTAQFEHISSMLASSTSLKSLKIFRDSTKIRKVFTRGFSSIAVALCSNQSLEALSSDIFSSMELKVLLVPLMLQNNNLQRNTTLTKLCLWDHLVEKRGLES